jgi:hypothetical protein
MLTVTELYASVTWREKAAAIERLRLLGGANE